MSMLDWAEQECRIACKRENPENWKYNTFNMTQALCTGDKERYKDIPQLMSIANYLSCILDELG